MLKPLIFIVCSALLVFGIALCASGFSTENPVHAIGGVSLILISYFLWKWQDNK